MTETAADFPGSPAVTYHHFYVADGRATLCVRIDEQGNGLAAAAFCRRDFEKARGRQIAYGRLLANRGNRSFIFIRDTGRPLNEQLGKLFHAYLIKAKGNYLNRNHGLSAGVPEVPGWVYRGPRAGVVVVPSRPPKSRTITTATGTTEALSTLLVQHANRAG